MKRFRGLPGFVLASRPISLLDVDDSKVQKVVIFASAVTNKFTHPTDSPYSKTKRMSSPKFLVLPDLVKMCPWPWAINPSSETIGGCTMIYVLGENALEDPLYFSR